MKSQNIDDVLATEEDIVIMIKNARIARGECPNGCYELLDVQAVANGWIQECSMCHWVRYMTTSQAVIVERGQA